MRAFLGSFTVAACALALAACGGSAGKTTPTASPTPSPVSTGGATASASAVSASRSARLSSTPAPTQTGPLLTGPGVSPGEVPPTRSSFSLPHTADGAIAFAAYFYRALDWSIATTDPYLLRQISASTCIGCYKYINAMTTLEHAGGYSVGGRGHATSFALVHGDSRVTAEFTVQVTLVQQSQVVVTSPSAAPTTYSNDGKPETNFLYVSWTNAGWQAIEIGTP
jgi:hypothetical protein